MDWKRAFRKILAMLIILVLLALVTDTLYLALMPLGHGSINIFETEIPLKQTDTARNFQNFEEIWQPDFPSPGSQETQPSRKTFLMEIDRFLKSIPLFSKLIYALIEALPLLVLLWYLRNAELEVGSNSLVLAERLRRVLISFLIFHFTLAAIVAVQDWLYNAEMIRSLSERVAAFLEPYFPIQHLPIYGMGAFRVGVVIVGIMMPVILNQRVREDQIQEPERKRRNWLSAPLVFSVGLFLLWGGGLATFHFGEGYRFLARDVYPLWALALLVAGITILILSGMLRWLCRNLSLQQPPKHVALRALFGLLLIGVLMMTTGGLISFELDQPYLASSIASYLWLIISTIWGVSLIWAFIRQGAYLTGKDNLWPIEKGWQKSTAVVLFFLLAIPMRGLISEGNLAAPYEVIYLAYRLDDLLPFFSLAGLIWLFWKEGNELKLTPFVRSAGLVAALIMFYNTRQSWSYIPLTFMLGWAGMAWLVRSGPETWESLSKFYDRVVKDRIEMLEEIVLLNAAERAYRALHKKASTDLETGTIANFETATKPFRESLVARHEEATTDGQHIKDLALAFGPYDSAIRNGLHGAKWALFFASPWLVIGINEFLNDPAPRQSYPLWGFLFNLFVLFARWAGIGFLFGYFYPYLRGKDGLRKGLLFFMVIVLPTLPLAALFNDSPTEWQATLVFVLQILIHCLLLGLIAFDYYTVRQGFRDWQMLFEVHGIPSVGVSVSTILLALSGTLVTLIQNRATDLVTILVQNWLPQFPIEQIFK